VLIDGSVRSPGPRNFSKFTVYIRRHMSTTRRAPLTPVAAGSRRGGRAEVPGAAGARRAGQARAARPDHLGAGRPRRRGARRSRRAIAVVVDRLDLRELYADVRARGEIAGAPATDPKILLGLWVYATSDGVGSGREIARLVELHAAYRWLCGGVAVAYHRLNDFRSDHGDVFSELVQAPATLAPHAVASVPVVAT